MLSRTSSRITSELKWAYLEIIIDRLSYVFVGCSLFFLVIGYIYFPETKRKTLEEIAAAFGDKVVLVTENEVIAEQNVLEEKAAGGRHVEMVPSVVKVE